MRYELHLTIEVDLQQTDYRSADPKNICRFWRVYIGLEKGSFHHPSTYQK